MKLEQNTRVDTEKRIRDGYRLLRSRSVHIGKIEKAFGLFRLSSRVSDRVQALAYMWLKTLWVPNEEIPYILAFSESEELRFTNSGGFKKLGPHLKACARIWNALARDYGHSALILMTLANHLSLIKSCLTALLPPYRKNHVTSLKELQNLLE